MLPSWSGVWAACTATSYWLQHLEIAILDSISSSQITHTTPQTAVELLGWEKERLPGCIFIHFHEKLRAKMLKDKEIEGQDKRGWNKTNGTASHTLDSSSAPLLSVSRGRCHRTAVTWVQVIFWGVWWAQGMAPSREMGVILLFTFRLSLLVSAFCLK